MPKTSVIVPVYNVAAYVEKCARSVLAQTERDLELLLVDDGSTDNSGALCDRLAKEDPRIRVIHQKNAGLGGARNTGIEAAQGEYLLFVDSDDWLEPGILESSRKAAEKTGADLVFFNFRTVDEAGNTLAECREIQPKNQLLPISEHKDIYLASPSAWNKLYRAALFRETGIRYPCHVWYEDIRTTLKLFLAADQAVFLEDIGYNYLFRQGSITNNLNAGRNKEIIEAFQDILSYFDAQKKGEEYEAELCYLTLFHVYLTASVRVLRIEKHHPLLKEFSAYLSQEFPRWKQNKYLPRLGKKRRLLLFLLEKKQYGLISLLFRLKG